MYDDLKGKIALITGAGRRAGIGFAIAQKLAACGANIVLTDTDRASQATGNGSEETLGALAVDLERVFGVAAMPLPLDVTDAVSINEAVEAVARRFDRVDVLVNNAGVALGVPAEVRNYEESAWLKTIDVNLHGVFRVSRAFLPMMPPAGGSIVNMASRAGKVAPLFNGAYAVAKAGVIMLTRVMALELADRGIRVNALCPGLIMTDMQAWRIGLEAEFFGTSIAEKERELAARVPMGRLGTPAQVADLAAFLASRQSSYITGQAINVCGGQTMEL